MYDRESKSMFAHVAHNTHALRMSRLKACGIDGETVGVRIPTVVFNPMCPRWGSSGGMREAMVELCNAEWATRSKPFVARAIVSSLGGLGIRLRTPSLLPEWHHLRPPIRPSDFVFLHIR